MRACCRGKPNWPLQVTVAIKVREYLATGKPVVISPLPNMQSMQDVLRIARSRDQFLTLVEEALEERDPAAAQRRQASVANGTWDVRAEWVSKLIEKALAKKNDESGIETGPAKSEKRKTVLDQVPVPALQRGRVLVSNRCNR